MLRQIGGGSYGSVWLARTATGIFRAVKVVWRDRFEDAEPYEREFRGLREFERVSLSESRQLALLHVGRRDAEGFFYYAMELADDVARGRDIEPATYRPLTLRELGRKTALPAKRVVELAVEMARGLAVLHDRQLVHRDIKPSNVILVEGAPKLADIGLVASSTMALTFVGTEGFVAPEGPGTPAADVYAMGKVLYELATGLDRQRFPELPGGFAERADRTSFLELNAVILRACEPDLKRRQPDARALLEDLLMIQAGKSVRRLWAAERGLARALKMVAVLALVTGIAAAGAWVAWNRAEQEMALRAEAEAERDALARKTQYAGLMAQASRAVERGDMGLARRALESAKEALAPDEPGFEWGWLWKDSWGGAWRVLQEGGASINRLALSPDGRRIAIADTQARMTVFEVESGNVVETVEGMPDLAGWSPDGRFILGVDARANAVAWDLERRERRTAEERFKLLWPLMVDAQGRMLSVEARGGGRLVRFDPGARPGEREQAVVNLQGAWADEPWSFFRHAVSADRQWIAVGWVRDFTTEAKFLLSVMSMATPTEVILIQPAIRPGELGWRRSANGEWELSVLDDQSGALGVWGPTERALRVVEKGEARSQGVVRSMGATVAVPQVDIELHGAALEDHRGGTTTHRVGHGGPVRGVVYDAKRDRLFSAAVDGSLLGWSDDGPRGEDWVLEGGMPGEPGLALLADDGRQMVLPTSAGLQALDVTTHERSTLDLPLRSVWVYDDALVLGVSADRRSVWGGEPSEIEGALLGLQEIRLDQKVSSAVTDENRALAVMTERGQLWYGRSWRNLRRVADLEYGWALSLDSTMSALWMAEQPDVARVTCRQPETGELIWTQRVPARVFATLYNPRRDEVLVSLGNGEIWVFNASNGVVLARMQSGAVAAHALWLSRDGSRLLAGGGEGDIQIIDPVTRLHLAARSIDRTGAVGWFSADRRERWLAVHTYAGRVHLLALPGR